MLNQVTLSGLLFDLIRNTLVHFRALSEMELIDHTVMYRLSEKKSDKSLM